MNAKSRRIAYWTSTMIFALFLLADGIAGLMHEETGRQVVTHLGYPIYVMGILGAAKIGAAIAIVQDRYRTIKEWAYAGFAISCYGAFVSRLVVGDTGIDLMFPVIFLLIAAIPYVLWKTAGPKAAAI
jgi:DoxX-like family